jgi:hypothetical protein
MHSAVIPHGVAARRCPVGQPVNQRPRRPVPLVLRASSPQATSNPDRSLIVVFQAVQSTALGVGLCSSGLGITDTGFSGFPRKLPGDGGHLSAHSLAEEGEGRDGGDGDEGDDDDQSPPLSERGGETGHHYRKFFRIQMNCS